MRKHILIIGGNDSSAVKAAGLGVDVTLFQLPRMVTQSQIESAKQVFLFDFEQLDDALALARTVHACHPFDAVVSFWERALFPAAVIAEQLGIPGNPVSAVQLTRNKVAMRELLVSNGDAIRFRKCSSPSEVTRFLSDVGGPIVLKPSNGSGSAGVSLITTRSEVTRAWKWASASDSPQLLVEEYIQGPEYSIESLTLNGQHRTLGITEKFTTGPPHFIETGHRFPADLPDSVARQIQRTVKRLLDDVGHRVGPAHTEIRLAGRPVIIETQTRFGGDQIWEIVELVTGVDLTKATCAHLLNLKPPRPHSLAQAAAIRFFTYENCEVVSVAGLDVARAYPGVVRVECKLTPGTRLGPLTASKARQGYVLAIGETADAAWNAATAALAKCEVELDSDPRRRARNSNGSRSKTPAHRIQRLLLGVRRDEQSFAQMLPLAANENLPSKLCQSMIASSLGNRYHLLALFERLPSNFVLKSGLMMKGLPGVYELEQAAAQAARDMFAADISDFRPLSGVHSTLCTLSLCSRPGDTVYSISPKHGGHFATRPILQRLGRKSMYLPWDATMQSWDCNALSSAFHHSPPAAILLDLGTVLQPLPIQTLRAAAGSRVRILYDGSHTFGLIAGGVFPNPLREGCDVLQGNTHKTFPGPQKAMLHFRSWDFGAKISSARTNGLVSTQHTHHALALYFAMLEMHEYGAAYAQQVVANAVALGTALETRGFDLIRAGSAPTQSNVILINHTKTVDVFQSCDRLFRAGIATNARTLNGRGILRLGTQEITRRGMREPEMELIADLVYRAVSNTEQGPRIRREIAALMDSYNKVHYSFDEALGF